MCSSKKVLWVWFTAVVRLCYEHMKQVSQAITEAQQCQCSLPTSYRNLILIYHTAHYCLYDCQMSLQLRLGSRCGISGVESSCFYCSWSRLRIRLRKIRKISIPRTPTPASFFFLLCGLRYDLIKCYLVCTISLLLVGPNLALNEWRRCWSWSSSSIETSDKTIGYHLVEMNLCQRVIQTVNTLSLITSGHTAESNSASRVRT